MDYDAAANYAIMNQLCKVCGEPAAGFHFGAFTCEGCKSFFGRTYNNISSISECKNNGKCVINKKNRTACKACRLRKCMMVGMSKSGSRYGRRSNWFKIHCLLQQQQQTQSTYHHPNDVTQNLAVAANLLRPNPYLPLFRNPPLPTNNPNPALRGGGGGAGDSASDSGASSDLDDETRTYLKSTTSPLMGDDLLIKSKVFLNNNNLKLPSLQRQPPAISISPAISPTTSCHQQQQQQQQQQRSSWFPPPQFPVVTDPGVWRELWLRTQQQPPPITVAVPDHHHHHQDEPIDLSVKTKPDLCDVKPEVKVEEEGEKVPLDLTI